MLTVQQSTVELHPEIGDVLDLIMLQEGDVGFFKNPKRGTPDLNERSLFSKVADDVINALADHVPRADSNTERVTALRFEVRRFKKRDEAVNELMFSLLGMSLEEEYLRSIGTLDHDLFQRIPVTTVHRDFKTQKLVHLITQVVFSMATQKAMFQWYTHHRTQMRKMRVAKGAV
jgi:hypothetical protein